MIAERAGMAMVRPGLRLGVFVDAPFYRDPATAQGALHVHPDAYSFLLFVYAVAEHFSHLTVLGRQARSADGLVALPASDRVTLCGLPAYDSLRDVRRVLRVTVPTARTMWRGLRDVDILWAMGPHPFGVIGGLLASARRRVVVLGVRQETNQYFKARVSPRQVPMLTVLATLESAYRVLGRMWRVTAVGSAVAGRYGAPRPGVFDMVVTLVRRSQRQELAVDDRPLDRVRLLTVGRIAVDKNPLLLVEAMSMLESREPGRFSLAWVGAGPLAEATMRRAEAADLGHIVDFAGFVPFGTALLDCYATADIFVHVALTEGVPQVLLEAAALGVPIVATEVGGVGEAMDRGRCAVLVPPDDCAALVDAIERVSNLPALRRAIAQNATERFEERTLEYESSRVAAFLVTGDRGGPHVHSHESAVA
jgi:glycosyltransferase involved in cell wall biosynthesis